jgi:hypothetical protein
VAKTPGEPMAGETVNASGALAMSDKHRITEINFEAGDHAMPQDQLEIDLALRAAKVVWEEYPYLQSRYGERGRRFTDSDSCWLVTLARAASEAEVTKALEWLRTVLASRGIPTLILEAHLRAIGAEFTKQSDAPIQFGQFLSDRKAERRRLFGIAGRSRLMGTFDARFRACTGFRIESAGQLITSAWVDQQAGIPGSVPALRDWLADAQRFSTDWIAVVDKLLAELDQVYG